MLNYYHDINSGFSSPYYKLFAIVDDIEYADKSGEITVTSDYFDANICMQHKTRETGMYSCDDANLKGRAFTEIFITTDTGEEIVSEAQSREGTPFIPYELINSTTKILEESLEVAHIFTRKETTEEWRRPDKTIFIKKTETIHKTVKPIPSPPMSPIPIKVTIPVHHYNKPVMFRGERWDWNVRYETVTIQHGESVPKAIILNSDWTFREYEY